MGRKGEKEGRKEGGRGRGKLLEIQMPHSAFAIVGN